GCPHCEVGYSLPVGLSNLAIAIVAVRAITFTVGSRYMKPPLPVYPIISFYFLWVEHHFWKQSIGRFQFSREGKIHSRHIMFHAYGYRIIGIYMYSYVFGIFPFIHI